MRPIQLSAMLAIMTPIAARTDCQAGIAAATGCAAALPASSGKAALLEQVQHADITRHEGDQADCADQLSMATDVLDRIDAAKREKAASPGR